MVCYQLCVGCWVLLLEEGSAVLLCTRLGKCSCLSHRKGKQNSLAWCEITCTAPFCSAVFRMCLREAQMHFAGWLSPLMAWWRGLRSHFSCGAEVLEGMTLGVHQVVALPSDAARPSQKGCLAITSVGKWKWFQRRFKERQVVTVKVTPGDQSSPAAVGSVFWALAVTLVHAWAMRAPDKLQKPWVHAWPLALFNSGFIFLFFEEGQRRRQGFPATMLFTSLFESVLSEGHQKLRYKATFWS